MASAAPGRALFFANALVLCQSWNDGVARSASKVVPDFSRPGAAKRGSIKIRDATTFCEATLPPNPARVPTKVGDYIRATPRSSIIK